MNHQLVTTEPHSGPQSAGSVRLHGNWLVLARLAWSLISTIAVVMLIVSLVTYAWWEWTFTEAECHDAKHVATNSSEFCLAAHRSYEQVFGNLPNFAAYSLVGKNIETLPWILIGD